MRIKAPATFGIIALLLFAAPSLQASQVVFGNLGSDGSGGLLSTSTAVTASNWLAQGFSTGALTSRLFIDQIVLGLEDDGAGVINTTISIWSNSGGSPGSLLVTSSSQSVFAETKYSFAFGAFELAPSTSYWVVLQQAGVRWSFAASEEAPSEQNSSDYSYLGTRRTVNSGDTWDNTALNAVTALSISASEAGPEPIPEPGTWAAAALLIGAAVYVRWRRRPRVA
jgi:hypothetical protein